MSTNAAVIVAPPVQAMRRPWIETPPADSAVVRDFVLPAATSHTAAAEQEAYERGYAEGHHEATDASAAKVAATIGRLSSAIQEISNLRTWFLKQSERDLVRLALEIAKRILQREASIDPGLLLEIAKGAVGKVAAARLVTIEMHPHDLAAATAGVAPAVDGPIDLVANPRLTPGTCIVQSAAGAVDVSIDAQIHELLDALLRDDSSR